jgi:hypothetical protein
VKAVQAFQLNISLLTYLQSGKKYYLGFGDSAMRAPKYDLHFFSDSVEKKPTEIGLKNIELNEVIIPYTRSSWFKNNQLILWIIIIVVLLSLTFFTFKMIGEVNKKKESSQE